MRSRLHSILVLLTRITVGLIATIGQTPVLFSIEPDFSNQSQVQAEYSYALGRRFAEHFLADHMEWNWQELRRGLEATMAEDPVLIDDAVLAKAKAAYEYQSDIALQAIYRNSLDRGREYLAMYRKQSGVRETDSGLAYEILVPGDSSEPRDPDVRASARIRLQTSSIDGLAMDWMQQPQPVRVPVNEKKLPVGLEEAIRLMPIGARYRFVVPSNLAFGETGYRMVLPNSTLIWDIELIEMIANPSESGNKSKP